MCSIEWPKGSQTTLKGGAVLLTWPIFVWAAVKLETYSPRHLASCNQQCRARQTAVYRCTACLRPRIPKRIGLSQFWYQQSNRQSFLPRDALLSAVYAVVVCLCVCVSVTLRYCIKTAKHRITQRTPHDSPMTLVFWCQILWRNSNGITSYGGDKCRWGRLEFVTFDEKCAITWKRYKIDA